MADNWAELNAALFAAVEADDIPALCAALAAGAAVEASNAEG